MPSTQLGGAHPVFSLKEFFSPKPLRLEKLGIRKGQDIIDLNF